MIGEADMQAREALSREDIEFLMRTELLRATPDEAKRRLMGLLLPTQVAAGERLITQGQVGDRFCVIQHGTCVVSLEKDGHPHPIARLKAGDVVGEIAVITGEHRSADVVAETEMTMWALPIDDFNALCSSYPPLLGFLTEIATERLCKQKITAQRTVGRYTLTEVVAEGGWSIVYEGVHSFLHLPVAVKMLKHNMAMDEDFFQRFQNEAKIIAGLNHEHIVKVYDIEHVYRTVFIVMEHLDGVTLRHILKERLRLPLARTVQILLQVCSGLHYAHQHGIVHQDVKPGNIFVQKDDRVKLVDFGLASPIGGCSDELPGTPHYMAPEQIEGDPVDPRTDVYSLGITAYEMVTGRRPYPDDICEVLRYHITAPTPDPRLLHPEIPQEFVDFIGRATAKDPEARHQNMLEVLEDLTALNCSIGVGPPVELRKRRRMMTLFMFYEDDRQLALNRLLDRFSEGLRSLGAELRVADFEDV